MRVHGAWALALLFLLAACAAPAPPPGLSLTREAVAALPGWRDDPVAAALPALRRSCAALARLPAAAPLGLAGTPRDWRAACAGVAALKAGDDAAARRFFATRFRAYAVAWNGRREGLFTGYFEPVFAGARRPGPGFATPLLRRPPDLVSVRPARGERIAGRVVDGRLVPYPSRAAIERGALDRLHLAFLWLADPVDAFILQIQGSGLVRLGDGTVVRVGYDGDNGRPYVAIGRRLVARGALAPDKVSLATIRAWLEAHPRAGRAVMDADPHYVFFREVAGAGPVGSEGVTLTPGRSLAVDPRFIPLGVPLWLDAAQAGRRLRRLVVAQDSGSAIRGAVRGDLFWGAGAAAEARAGDMRAKGGYAVLLPRALAPGGT